jgi:hypothetical protein
VKRSPQADVQDKTIDHFGSKMVWTMKWMTSSFQILCAVVAIVSFIVAAGLLLFLDDRENIHFPMGGESLSVKENNVFVLSEAGQSGLQLRHLEEPFSLRLRRSWFSGMAWEYSPHDLCMECETEGQNDTCLNGDRIVLGHCRESRPQLFTFDKTDSGEGRLKTHSDPDLCLTISEGGQEITLSQCQTSNLHQVYSGLEAGYAFELKSVHHPELCLVIPQTKQLSFEAALCSKALKHDRVLLEAVFQRGLYDRHTRQTQSCPRTCLDVFQREKSKYVGQFYPVATSQSVDRFYRYNADNDFGYNGDEITPLDAETSIVFVHQDSIECDLALVTVHGAKELKDDQECRPGGVVFYITGNLEDSVVQDGRNSPSDSFTYIAATDETNCDWTWSWQKRCEVRTDGLAHWWDPDELPCIKVRPESFVGINHWKYVPGEDESDVSISFDQYVSLDMDEELEICAGACE